MTLILDVSSRPPLGGHWLNCFELRGAFLVLWRKAEGKELDVALALPCARTCRGQSLRGGEMILRLKRR